MKLSETNEMIKADYISEELIIHHIKNESIFKSAYKSFLREHKLNKLLGDEDF